MTTENTEGSAGAFTVIVDDLIAMGVRAAQGNKNVHSNSEIAALIPEFGGNTNEDATSWFQRISTAKDIYSVEDTVMMLIVVSKLRDNAKNWFHSRPDCKAGAGGRCKHIVACLLFINRNSLEELSCTELQQAWGKRKQQLHNLEVEALQNFCHIKQIKLGVERDIDPSISSNTIEQLILGLTERECGKTHFDLRCVGNRHASVCDVCVLTSPPTTPRKKAKLLKAQKKYKHEWKYQYDWLTSDPVCEFNPKCKICALTFTISHAGVGQFIYSVISYDNGDLEAVPSVRLNENKTICYWPPKSSKNITTLIKNCAKPNEPVSFLTDNADTNKKIDRLITTVDVLLKEVASLKVDIRENNKLIENFRNASTTEEM
ncbi:hypothetical protein RN001_005879 [Aquatica leii]|uniref:Uncharacterized protein n=1 Tax=Aquatica leii TaxID=1421715 RepID=A0AAN7Q8E2_9COLE|nr:hypothetical protein RN001_005879 [Aquatica leii]